MKNFQVFAAVFVVGVLILVQASQGFKLQLLDDYYKVKRSLPQCSSNDPHLFYWSVCDWPQDTQAARQGSLKFEFSCQDRPDGLYSNEVDCRTFYVCSNGAAYLYNCPESLYFNPITQQCDYLENVPYCDGNNDTATTSATTTTQAPVPTTTDVPATSSIPPDVTCPVVTCPTTPESSTCPTPPEPITCPTTPEPITCPTTPEPITCPTTPEPITCPTTPEPITCPTTPEPITCPTPPEPITCPTTPEPITCPTPPEPITCPTPPEPITCPTTPEPITCPTPPEPITCPTTPEPITCPTTPEPITCPTTPEPITCPTPPEPITCPTPPAPITCPTPPVPTTPSPIPLHCLATISECPVGYSCSGWSNMGYLCVNQADGSHIVPSACSVHCNDACPLGMCVRCSSNTCY